MQGYQWPLGASVTLTVDDPKTPENADYTKVQAVTVAPWDPNQTFVQFRPWEEEFSLRGGMTVTMSDGRTVKTHLITSLAITNIDPDAETVSGTAAPGTQVGDGHSYCDQTGCHGYRRVTADANGNWVADFAHVGEDPDEQDIIDLEPGSGSEAVQWDPDWDETRVR